MKNDSYELRELLAWIVAMLRDSSFLVIWVMIQFGTNWVIGHFQPSGVDEIILRIFQIIFGLSTLVPVVLFNVANIVTMTIRTRRRIQRVVEEEVN